MPRDEFENAPSFVLTDPFGNESRPVRALRDVDGTVRLQDGRTLPLDEFLPVAARSDETGVVICRMGAALYQQSLALRRAAARGLDGVGAHVADLADLRRLFGPADASPAAFDLHMTDIFTSRVRDHVVRQEDLEAGAVAAAEEALISPRPVFEVLDMNPLDVETPDKVIARIQQDTGISADRWVPVSAYPTYMIEQVRGMARAMLAPVLGNVASLEDLRRLEIRHSEVERHQSVLKWVSQAEERKDLPPFTHPKMPGYVTSAPVLAEMNGVTMLVFSDFNAHYVYAWQSDPDMSPDLGAPRGPRG